MRGLEHCNSIFCKYIYQKTKQLLFCVRTLSSHRKCGILPRCVFRCTTVLTQTCRRLGTKGSGRERMAEHRLPSRSVSLKSSADQLHQALKRPSSRQHATSMVAEQCTFKRCLKQGNDWGKTLKNNNPVFCGFKKKNLSVFPFAKNFLPLAQKVQNTRPSINAFEYVCDVQYLDEICASMNLCYQRRCVKANVACLDVCAMFSMFSFQCLIGLE